MEQYSERICQGRGGSDEAAAAAAPQPPYVVVHSKTLFNDDVKKMALENMGVCAADF